LTAAASQEQDSRDAVEPTGEDRPVLILDLQDAIGPATADFISRSLEEAAERRAELLVIRMDTPGGLDAATRDIIKDILASAVPVATFVNPEGARAASAGAYILLASHVAAMSPATNVGAATPVNIMGGGPKPYGPPGAESDTEPDAGEEDAEAATPPPADASMRKVLNDSVAYIRGLAERRGRNADWAEKAVLEADSITAEQALELGVIDLMARNLGELLSLVDGFEVEVQGQRRNLDTEGRLVEQLEPDWRNEFLAAITSPTIAYLLLLVGIYGLILEGYNPGAFLPGIVGAICLLLALYSLQMLPVNYVGLALIGLGVILMIAEAIAPSFGVLGIGGIIALVFGSIMLIDTEVPGMGVSRPLIGAIAAVAGVGLMGIVAVAMKARRRPQVAGREQLIGARGEALEDFEHEGEVWLHSERWTAVTESPLRKDQPVEVIAIDGLELRVRPAGPPPD
jgi:membrane-bound serine protease (ClpP class)